MRLFKLRISAWLEANAVPALPGPAAGVDAALVALL